MVDFSANSRDNFARLSALQKFKHISKKQTHYIHRFLCSHGLCADFDIFNRKMLSYRDVNHIFNASKVSNGADCG